MNRKVIIVACLLTILVVVAIAYVILSSPSSTLLYVDPQTVHGTTSQNVTINISISNVADLYGWELKLGWNASLLNLVSVNEGLFLKSGGATFFTYHLNTTDEHLVVDCTLEGNVPGVNGTGTLMMAQFQVIENGTCDLNLYDTQVFDSKGTAMSHLVHGGHFNS
jgi:hypothetical protein